MARELGSVDAGFPLFPMYFVKMPDEKYQALDVRTQKRLYLCLFERASTRLKMCSRYGVEK